MIMPNPEHIPSDDAMKNNLSCPSGISSLNMPIFLWDHLFADQRGRLALFSGVRGPDPRKLLASAVGYFSRPDEAGSAVESALAESNRGRETCFRAHLLTEKRRTKENAPPLRALYVDGDGEYPGEELSQPAAIIESSPGCLQMGWRLRIPRTRCYELIARGELPAVRIGERSIRVHREELERFLLETRRIVARGQGGGVAPVALTTQ
jgi:excisionase family DNA binding protein